MSEYSALGVANRGPQRSAGVEDVSAARVPCACAAHSAVLRYSAPLETLARGIAAPASQQHVDGASASAWTLPR